MTTSGFLFQMIKRFPRQFVGNVLLLLSSAVLETLALLSLVPVVDLFSFRDLSQSGSVTRYFVDALNWAGIPASLTSMMLVLITFQGISSALSIVAARSILRTKYNVITEIMMGSFNDFFSAGWCFFSGNSQGTLLNTFTRSILNVGDAFSGIGMFLIVGARIISYGVVPLTISWKVTLFCVGLAGLGAIPFLLLGKISYRLGKINTETANDMMSLLHASLGGAKVVLGYGNEKKSAHALRRLIDEHAQVSVKFQTLSQGIPVAYKPLGLGILLLALLLSRRLDISIAEMAVMMLAFLQMIPQVGQLIANKSSLQNMLPAYEQILGLREEAKRLKQITGSRPFVSFKKELTLDRVSFSFPGRPPVFKDISIRIGKGQFVAIVGESGAGKSTLVDLIMGLHEPTGGEIAVDGVPLREFDVRSFRQRIGYVPQESILFNTTIRENLMWANEDAKEDDIHTACRQANAAEFIEKLPQGYETVVGDRGVRLSGGQVQRMSLARAILRNPFLLVLDEATSALDTKSERLIQQSVESLAKGTTVIAIAHRLSTIINADHIILLREGGVAEEGTYTSLINRNTYFHRLVQAQSLTRETHEGAPA